MKLLLLRHGPAGDRAKWAAVGKPDGERPLTAKGAEKTRLALRGLRRILPRVDRVATSPLKRASETAKLAVEAYPKAALVRLADLSPGGDRRRLQAWLKGQSRKSCVVFVGHEPALSRLAGELLAEKDLSLFELRKAGAALLEFPEFPALKPARLAWALRPSHLRRLGA